MKNKVLIIVAILLLLPNAMAWAHQPADGNLKHFTKKDATTAMDAFHSTFYNPDMKLYEVLRGGSLGSKLTLAIRN